MGGENLEGAASHRPRCSILLVSGSLRSASINSAVLRTVQDVAPSDVDARAYSGTSGLPHFNPDDDRDPPSGAVADLRAAIGAADAVLFCTPEYAGTLPGSFKNLLDWTVGGTEMTAKPVAWINAASPASPAGGEDAHAALRKVLGYVNATIVEAACLRLPIPRQAIGSDGIVDDEDLRRKMADCVKLLTSASQTEEPLLALPAERPACGASVVREETA